MHFEGTTRHRERGSLLVELCLVIGLLCLLCFGIVSLQSYIRQRMMVENLSHMAALTMRSYCAMVGSVDRQDCLDWVNDSLVQYAALTGHTVSTHLALYEKPGGIVQKTHTNTTAFSPSAFSPVYFSTNPEAQTALDNIGLLCTIEVQYDLQLLGNYFFSSGITNDALIA